MKKKLLVAGIALFALTGAISETAMAASGSSASGGNGGSAGGISNGSNTANGGQGGGNTVINRNGKKTANSGRGTDGVNGSSLNAGSGLGNGNGFSGTVVPGGKGGPAKPGHKHRKGPRFDDDFTF